MNKSFLEHGVLILNNPVMNVPFILQNGINAWRFVISVEKLCEFYNGEGGKIGKERERGQTDGKVRTEPAERHRWRISHVTYVLRGRDGAPSEGPLWF